MAKYAPNAEQMAALKAWAKEKGKGWKAKLYDAWMSGNYKGFKDAGLLQQIRNQVDDEEWLPKLKLKVEGVEGDSMSSLIERLQEGAGLAEALSGSANNLGKILEGALIAFFKEVALAVNAQLKGSAMMSGAGGLTASVESQGFDWPVLVVARNGEDMVYDLEVTIDMDRGTSAFVVNKWDGSKQDDTKVMKVSLGMMDADRAAKFLVNYVRRDVATQISARG
jgi:hypothetical protein